MATNKFGALRQSGLLLLILFVWIVAPEEGRGQMLYKYIDEEGTFVITDNPPPEFTLVPDTPPDVMEAKKLEAEKEKENIQTLREAQEIRVGKEEKIRAARDDWEKARSYEENYRLNMQQTTDYNQRLYWRGMLDKQQKVVEEKKKKLDEIMSLP